MGCYDTVIIHCPKCGAEYCCQSKGGDCLLDHYTLATCPDEVFSDINRHAPFECVDCGAMFYVDDDRKEVVHG